MGQAQLMNTLTPQFEKRSVKKATCQGLKSCLCMQSLQAEEGRMEQKTTYGTIFTVNLNINEDILCIISLI